MELWLVGIWQLIKELVTIVMVISAHRVKLYIAYFFDNKFVFTKECASCICHV